MASFTLSCHITSLLQPNILFLWVALFVRNFWSIHELDSLKNCKITQHHFASCTLFQPGRNLEICSIKPASRSKGAADSSPCFSSSRCRWRAINEVYLVLFLVFFFQYGLQLKTGGMGWFISDQHTFPTSPNQGSAQKYILPTVPDTGQHCTWAALGSVMIYAGQNCTRAYDKNITK